MLYITSSLRCLSVSNKKFRIQKIRGQTFIQTDHGEEATKHLKAFIGDHYHVSNESVFPALWRTYNECQFVDDEG